ncbi:hypothetical protein RHGRI_032269 [Rhododendron griersonianum]|uniref:Uncharacterized protein n=1 Tax=Rhododendron griersonianum TaxID=479676 RepID=A0AAV6IB25_9ERIC|nr:hypothetical protein RHGRI_032269 [Rhododendron griersonianum]
MEFGNNLLKTMRRLEFANAELEKMNESLASSNEALVSKNDEFVLKDQEMVITNIQKNDELMKLLTYSRSKEWRMKVIVLMLVFIVVGKKNCHLMYLA